MGPRDHVADDRAQGQADEVRGRERLGIAHAAGVVDQVIARTSASAASPATNGVERPVSRWSERLTSRPRLARRWQHASDHHSIAAPPPMIRSTGACAGSPKPSVAMARPCSRMRRSLNVRPPLVSTRAAGPYAKARSRAGPDGQCRVAHGYRGRPLPRSHPATRVRLPAAAAGDGMGTAARLLDNRRRDRPTGNAPAC